MSQNIVGLFEDAKDAKRALDDLMKQGFGRNDVLALTSAKESADALRELSARIGEPDIRFYQEGVKRGGTLVVVEAASAKAQQAATILRKYKMVDVDARLAEYRTAGADVALRDYGDEDLVLPVVEEQINVAKRDVERGRMRVYTRVTERPVEEQVTLREERVNVERRPVDRAVTAADTLFKEQSFEVKATGEEAVVQKTSRVIEEVVVGKEMTERTETIRDSVRRTDVEVDQMENQQAVGASRTPGYESFDQDFRTYYTSTLAKSGYTYEQYAPVFRYGYDMRNDKRFAGKDWNVVEHDVRTSWEEGNPGTWEQFKDGIRYAWNRATNK
jgi:uncharacterized protein (TIGR02271 family)